MLLFTFSVGTRRLCLLVRKWACILRICVRAYFYVQIVARQPVLSWCDRTPAIYFRGRSNWVSFGDEAKMRLVNPRHGLGVTCTACSVSCCGMMAIAERTHVIDQSTSVSTCFSRWNLCGRLWKTCSYRVQGTPTRRDLKLTDRYSQSRTYHSMWFTHQSRLGKSLWQPCTRVSLTAKRNGSASASNWSSGSRTDCCARACFIVLLASDGYLFLDRSTLLSFLVTKQTCILWALGMGCVWYPVLRAVMFHYGARGSVLFIFEVGTKWLSLLKWPYTCVFRSNVMNWVQTTEA